MKKITLICLFFAPYVFGVTTKQTQNTQSTHLPFYVTISNKNNHHVYQTNGCTVTTSYEPDDHQSSTKIIEFIPQPTQIIAQAKTPAVPALVIANNNSHKIVQENKQIYVAPQPIEKRELPAHLTSPTSSATKSGQISSRLNYFSPQLLPTLHTGLYALGGIGLGYLALAATLVIQAKSTADKTGWASWQKEKSIADLHAQEQKTAQELFADIQKKYQAAQDQQNSNFLNPLIHFFNEVNNQIAACKRYIKIVSWLDTLKLTKIFPDQTKLVEKATRKIRRLTYFKQLITHWVGEYKVELPAVRIYQ